MAAAQQSATAPDCSRAKTSVERAICTTPELRAADAAMANAYSALKVDLPGAQRSALLADQRRWIELRDAICADKSDRAARWERSGAPGEDPQAQRPDLVGCVLAQTDRRRRFLAGEWPNRAPDAPRLQPAFFPREGLYEINAVYPRIVKPRSPSERAFNKAARGLVLGKEAFDYGRDTEPLPGSSMPSYYDASYDVTYLDRRLAAVVFTISTYGAGAAHPNTRQESLIFDFSRGRALTTSDVIGSPAEAVPAIWRECESQLKAQAAKEGWPGDPEPWPDDPTVGGVGELAHWAPDKAGIDIVFCPGSIMGRAYAPVCRLSWADLSPWLKPNGPLPPH
jgi:uncharacterized protein YecT (DUF1311 family)